MDGEMNSHPLTKTDLGLTITLRGKFDDGIDVAAINDARSGQNIAAPGDIWNWLFRYSHIIVSKPCRYGCWSIAWIRVSILDHLIDLGAGIVGRGEDFAGHDSGFLDEQRFSELAGFGPRLNTALVSGLALK